MVRLVALCGVLVFAFAAVPARAGDLWGCTDTAYWGTRDAIYQEFELIARLEANPDVDEGVKGPLIAAARAEIRRLRATISDPPPDAWPPLGSPLREWQPPRCFYTRKRVYL